MLHRFAAAIIALNLIAPLAGAEEVNLAEAPASGECNHYSVELDLTGKMMISQGGKQESIGLEAKARHIFSERTLTVEDGLPLRTARYYDNAVASAVVDVEKLNRDLPENRRLIVVVRNREGLCCFCPAGALKRDELDLVTEHFNTQCLAGLLPGKPVNIGDTWNIGPAAAQAACLFDGLIKNNLVGKLTAAADGKATFTIEGTAEGIEHGAKVSLTITATGTFDTTAKRIVALTWKQKDDREQGPIAPASQVNATVTLKRQTLAQAPKELNDAALVNVPKGDVPAAMLQLQHDDPKGRYSLIYSRDWHITGQTDQHLILRLLDVGEFVAQATVAVWKKAEAGKHTSAEEFKKAVNATPGWAASRVIEDGETTIDGRWFYRLVAEGKLDDLPVTQCFALIAGPNGDQAAVTVTYKTENAKAIGTRDKDLIQAITFPKPR